MTTLKNEVKRLGSLLEINKKGIIVIKAKAKEVDMDITREMHGIEFFPDDFRYSTISSILDNLLSYDFEDLDDLENIRHEVIDNLVDVYNHDLLKWLSSDLKRLDYCDEASDIYGPSETLINGIRVGQYMEIEEIFSNLVRHLESLDLEEVA